MIKQLVVKLTQLHLTRFLIVGGFSTIINYAVFYISFTNYPKHYQIASAIGFLAGITLGFHMNKRWTYSNEQPVSIALGTKYLAVYLFSLGVSLVFLYGLVEVIGIHAQIANILTIMLTTCINFVGTKFWVFRP